MKTKKVLLVDMDGVMCDFDKAKTEAIAKVPEILHPQCQMDFFRKLEPIRNAIKVINNLRKHFEVFILTSPSIKNPLSYTEKMLWVQDHFDRDMVERLIITKHKELVEGDFLIDDRPKHNGAIREGRELIHFGSESFPDWASVYKYLMETI